jgi:hypothetical protein
MRARKNIREKLFNFSPSYIEKKLYRGEKEGNFSKRHSEVETRKKPPAKNFYNHHRH